MSTTPKLSRESRHAFAHRFSANLKRILEEKHLSMAEVGRKMRPGVKNPTSTVFFLLRAKQLPKDEVMETLAKALGCPVESFHAGELDDFKHTPAEAAALGRKARALVRAPRQCRSVSPVRVPPPSSPPADVDPLYSFVLDDACRRAVILPEPRRREFITALAHLCREYPA
jgi:hypothetical protein